MTLALKGEKYTGTALDLMAAVQTTIDGMQGGAGKQKRQSYKRERKLEVIAFYHSSNLYKTLREFSLNTNEQRSQLQLGSPSSRHKAITSLQ